MFTMKPFSLLFKALADPRDSWSKYLYLSELLTDGIVASFSHAKLQCKLDQLIFEVRSGKRDGSIVSARSIGSMARNDREIWDALRRELVDIGISPAVITERRQFIITWFQEAVKAGRLEEDAPDDNHSDSATVEGSEPPADIDNIHHSSVPDSVPVQKLMPEQPTHTVRVRAQPSEGLLTSRQGSRKSASRISYIFDKLRTPDQAIRKAVKDKDSAKAKSLLEKGGNVKARALTGMTLLHLASENADLEIVRMLLARKANVNTYDIGRLTPLHYATISGDEKIVTRLLKSHANMAAESVLGRTPLHTACASDHPGCVRVLLTAGANFTAKDDNGRIPLHTACLAKSDECVRLLLSQSGAGAVVEAGDQLGWTPLHHASKVGGIEGLLLLLEKGATVNSTTKKKLTPLHIAIMKGQPAAARVLLDKGADVRAKSLAGHTPSYHLKSSDRSMKQLLEAHEAKILRSFPT